MLCVGGQVWAGSGCGVAREGTGRLRVGSGSCKAGHDNHHRARVGGVWVQGARWKVMVG